VQHSTFYRLPKVSAVKL
jgi:hypothetical protein